ncbi:MAG: GyrI-like domain-containing protein [Eubacteriales bacterium]|nr:GyrI-like domain-containing protein [Eubacteriales bacterium]
MDYTLEDIGELTVLGYVRKFGYENAFQEIPKFWSEFFHRELQNKLPGRLLGVCFDEADSPEFPYMIGVFCDPDAPVPEGFEKRTIAAHTWVKFNAVGPIPEGIQKVNRQIFTEWLPNNAECDLAEGVNIEIYPEGDMKASDYVSEIWLPIRHKG